MKRTIKIFFMMALMITLISPLTEATTPINLGTIPYKGNTVLLINKTYEVNLSLLYTPLPNSITYTKLGFNPATNKTAYSFLSLTVPIDHTFKNDTKTHLFQDTADQIYRLSINFTTAIVPKDPLKTNYTTLWLKYNNTLSNYTKINNSLNNMTRLLNSTITGWNASVHNMTQKYNSTYDQLQSMSLNASLAQTTIHALHRDNEALKNDILITQITALLLIIFFSIVSIVLAKKFGWLIKGQEGRMRKKLDSGYGELQKKYDNYIIRKNDEITRKRNGISENPQETKEQIPPFHAKERFNIPNTPERENAQRFADDLPNKRTQIIPQETREIPYVEQGMEQNEQTPSIQEEEPSMLTQGEVIKKLCKEGATRQQIIDLTGYDKQYVNTICKKHEIQQ